MGAASNWWENRLVDGIFRRGISARQMNTAYSLGQMIYGGNASSYGKVMLCTTAGTSHATVEPTWGAVADPPNTATDGTAVFTIYQVGMFSPPLYVGLITTLTDIEAGSYTECSGTNYARQLLAPSLTNWTATQGGTTNPSSGSSGTTGNAATLSFPAAGVGGWTTLNAVGIFDALTGGNLLYAVSVTAQAIAQGNVVSFNAGSLQITVD